MRKYKTKINRKNRRSQGVDAPQPVDSDLWADLNIEGDEEELSASIVRTKRLSLKPMDAEEAVLQMDMLGHNFFIFEDADTNGTSIVYKRKDGKYGLIETD